MTPGRHASRNAGFWCRPEWKDDHVATPVSVASYVLNAPSVSVTFSSLVGMSWLIVPATTGNLFGTPSQPIVTLQRAAYGTTETWTWYQLALTSNPSGR